MLPAIQNTQECAGQFVKVLVYGRAGVGKTFLCATAPAPLILSAESGLLSLRHHNLPFMQITEYSQLMEIHRWLQADPQARASFQTICLDSITEILDLVLTASKKANADGRQAYGQLNDDGMAIIRLFRDLPYNVYFSATQGQVKDEVIGGMLFGPDAPGKQLPQKLPYQFDEVFNLDVAKDPQGKPYRFLRTVGDAQYTAKDRSGVLAPAEHPDLTYLFNKIRQVTP